MIRDEFELINNEILNKAKILRIKKGTDYERTSGDILFNFKDAENAFGIEKTKAIGLLMKKQIDAIYTFIKTGQLESESLESRIIDSINYLLLFNAMIKENEKTDDTNK